MVLTEIGSHAGRLIPALDAVHAKEWVQKGASDAYVAQLESSREQARAIETTSRALAKSPERLADSLELLLRRKHRVNAPRGRSDWSPVIRILRDDTATDVGGSLFMRRRV